MLSDVFDIADTYKIFGDHNGMNFSLQMRPKTGAQPSTACHSFLLPFFPLSPYLSDEEICSRID